MPTPFEAVLLALAAWRIWHLIANDDLTERPRTWALARLHGKWDDFIACPYCAGFHLSLVIYLFWVWLPDATIYVCIPFALNAAVIALSKILSSD